MPTVLLMSLGPHLLQWCRVYLSPILPLPSKEHMSTVNEVLDIPILAEDKHTLWTSELPITTGSTRVQL